MNGPRRIVRRPSGVDVSVDVTPVMNMFVILIPFLVSMAAFSHLAVQQLALPGNEAAGSAQTEEEAALVVSVTGERILAVRGNRTVGAAERRLSSAAPRGEGSAEEDRVVDGEELAGLLRPILRDARSLFPVLDRVTLAVADEVVCSDVVACFDACREAGFLDVGIAEAVR